MRKRGARASPSQARVFERARRQALGLLCALGIRTVARVLAATGRDQCDWSAEYRLFSRRPWTSRALFFPIIQHSLAFAGEQTQPIVLAGDFTHLLKSGKKTHCVIACAIRFRPPSMLRGV
jgi:hypothetical protein